MPDDNVAFLEGFIGRGWLDAEFRKIHSKTHLKELGGLFDLYHPWVQFKYEVTYLLRRSESTGQKYIAMGRYHDILDNAGMLLKENLNYIVDKNDARMRLRDPKEFYDFIWELEVRTMLSRSGARVDFVDPNSGLTYDGVAFIAGKDIPFECKNKWLDNRRYNDNSVFALVLARKLERVASIRNKIVQIEFEESRLEDIPSIVSTIRDKFDVINYRSILGRYKVRVIKNVPFNAPMPLLLDRVGISAAFVISERDKKELYLGSAPSDRVLAKLLIKAPEQIYELRNLNSVLKKANRQLLNGGILFMKVPYSTIESAKAQIGDQLSRQFSNIYAVKLLAVEISDVKGLGVKVFRQEELLLSPTGERTLAKEVIDFLTRPMAFMKYS